MLVTDATLVTLNPARDLVRGDLLIDGGRLVAVGTVPPDRLAAQPAAERLDASGLLALPGLVQTHVHICQTLFRNLAEGYELLDWLRRRIWPFEAAHDPRKTGTRS